MRPVFCIAILAGLLATLTGGEAPAVERTWRTTGSSGIIYSAPIRRQQAPAQLRYRRPAPGPQNIRANRGTNIAAIRADAIRETLVRLTPLRPYTTNFNHLKTAIRQYWHHNIHRPTTRGLAGTIMAHVKGFYKGLVRSQVYADSRTGIARVKRALRNLR